jgi:hypothetical protein
MSALPLRGLMLDAARWVESPDYYRRFLDFCAEWRINAVIFRLTDDQGCAVRFRSHPELVTHANALTPKAVAGLARYAAKRGVELIPEIESLGHARYITQTAQHADLNDHDPDGTAGYNAVIPLHPKTLRLLGDLYAETVELFPSRYLHAGCDEVNWGGSAFSRDLLATRSRAAVWSEYLNTLRARIEELGRQMIIWDDMVLQHDPGILDRLDRRIILHDWEYAGTDPAPVAARLALARDKGFRMIGGPALHWCKWGPRVGTAQLGNIDAYADVYRAAGDGASLGVIVTNWCPSRYVRDSIWDGLAYAAVAMNEGGAPARTIAFPRFVERHYGAAWDDAWAEVFTAVYDGAPTRHGREPAPLVIPWANEDELQRAVGAAPMPSLPFERTLGRLDELQGRVRRHSADFAAFRLSIAYLAHLYWRHATVRGRAGGELATRLAEVARRDAAMADALAGDWRAGRAGDPEIVFDGIAGWGLGAQDRLHSRFMTAARFSRQASPA